MLEEHPEPGVKVIGDTGIQKSAWRKRDLQGCCPILLALCFRDTGTKGPSFSTATQAALVTIITNSGWRVLKY